MNRSKAITIGKKMMAKHDLVDWKIEIDVGVRRRVGQCRHSSHIIGLTGWYVDLNDEDEVRDTMAHEIAHALVGTGHGHNKVWKAMAAQLGATPKKVGKKINQLPPRLVATCQHCNSKHYLNRRPRTSRVCTCTRRLQHRPILSFMPYRAVASKLVSDQTAFEGLMRSLGEAKLTGDRVRARQVRAQLRRMGHAGGLRGSTCRRST